ncbi:MAG: hypothetical protein IJ196_05915 [Prevotella sp.]|nr:hypothetical protein [Prevotella sp.]
MGSSFFFRLISENSHLKCKDTCFFSLLQICAEKLALSPAKASHLHGGNARFQGRTLCPLAAKDHLLQGKRSSFTPQNIIFCHARREVSCEETWETTVGKVPYMTRGHPVLSLASGILSPKNDINQKM